MSERSIFLTALEKQTPQERDAYLDEACAGDAALRRRVEALLREHEGAGSFLEEPAAEVVTDKAPGPPPDTPGAHVGPYKLLQRIGEGGFGIVFMAEQDHPVRRRVALKIIKPGMDSAQVVARFEAERQALALMDHQHIARVFDAGATPAGRPYFVMELVHGVPITQYCDDNHLSPRERLELIIPVCQAIQHAHQKGIIHRDVKPSNVLVTLYDGRPVPKVIDFGVAKAIEQRLTERTMFTHYGTIVGTFEYMAPEQAEMSALGVDTRSDIYSLGVLLYELLTGSTPLERRRVREAAYAEVVRMIKEDEPPRPSARLSTSATLPAIAAARKTEPAALARLVRGELDWIVMKCLEKDRGRRYETANGLVRDLQRYLADEPVEACPPKPGYRLVKFARKNRKLFVTAAAFLLLLAAAALFSAFLAVQARQAETAARNERDATARALAQVQALSDFLTKDLLGKAAPGQAENGPKVTVEDLLAQAARRIDHNAAIARQPEVEATLRWVIGYTLFKVGNPTAAEAHLYRSLALRKKALGPDHPDTLDAQEDLAYFLNEGMGDFENSAKLAKATWEARQLVLGPDDPKTLTSLDTYCGGLSRLRRFPEVHLLRQQCLEARTRILGLRHPETLDTMANVGFDLNEEGRHDDAEPILRQCLKLRIETDAVGPKDLNTLAVRSNLGLAQWYRGKFAEAEQTLQEALAVSRELLDAKAWQNLYLQHVLVRILFGAEKYREAEQLGRATLADRRDILGRGNPHVGRSLVVLGLVLLAQDKADDADALFREALSILRDKKDDFVLQAEMGRGAALILLGRSQEAEPLLAAAWPRVDTEQRIPAWQRRRTAETVARAYERAGQAAAAAAWRGKVHQP
jgi:serine/threonine protein kinase